MLSNTYVVLVLVIIRLLILERYALFPWRIFYYMRLSFRLSLFLCYYHSLACSPTMSFAMRFNLILVALSLCFTGTIGHLALTLSSQRHPSSYYRFHSGYRSKI
ncbi:hypothetical protein F5890DRAFT_788832 [Lentinula detonsa]|uniref:Uncharacterized protein n=1 Tax=Lentinula detonsa TaxID=2804962 RepID=A0AA38PRM7_9AGAR|nr:hypothetical protein F5890DRAFT_788832 [Lentinula detonsa]